ncbi:MAG: aminotransferase class I/II-fold pyridoxal phosphate-dependent enzyme [Deltaproteobacteria bacterium]|nr:aminotransferase class I/II-fold pyridoxal phosphate-dependent enzyme [Deltaproteobacteria bacterium]
MNVRKWVRKEVLEQQAYAADVINCQIKLDANENPFALSPPLQAKLLERMKAVPLNRYPDAGAPLLRKRFAQYYGVNENMLMIGNGSDELIQILCMALAGPVSDLLIPIPTFAMYRILGLNNGYHVREVPLDNAFDLNVKAIVEKISKKTLTLTFISYPNNPTGNCFSADRIETILDKSTGIVVVDEAYFNFSEKTELITELDKVRLPYNLNTLSQIAAIFFLDHEEMFLDQIHEIIRERKSLLEKLNNLEGIQPYPSDANFIFFSCTLDANNVCKQILRQGILIKPIKFPRSGQTFIRVTVGKCEENEAFIQALKSVITK